MRSQGLRATFILGTDGLQRALDAPAGPGLADNYPPYDLERIAGAPGRSDRLRLVFAVAGFAPEQLEIIVAGDQLSITGEQIGDADPQRFLHRGIAARRFRRVFRLAEGLGVEQAVLMNGLLSIDVVDQRPARGSRTIEIGVRDF